MPGPQLKGKATLDDSQMEAAFRRIGNAGKAAAGKVSGSFGGIARSLVGPLAAIGPAIAAAFAGKAIVSGVNNVFTAGRALAQLSRSTGANIGGLVILQKKFKEAGLSSDQVATSIFRLQKSINGVEDEENKGGAGRLEQLGLDLQKLKGLSADQQLFAVGRAIGALQNPSERTAAAMQIFGRAGGELGAVFRGLEFNTVSAGLQAKAEGMARSATLFEQVALKLERTKDIMGAFYAGVASEVASSVDRGLDQINKINLFNFGKRFGDVLVNAERMAVGAFMDPEALGETVKAGFTYGVLAGGNVLMATFSTGVDFFRNALIDMFEGLGDVIISTLMKSFDKPLRYAQAMVEQLMERWQAAREFENGKERDTTGLAALSDEQIAQKLKGLQDVSRRRYDKVLGPNPDERMSPGEISEKLGKDPIYTDLLKRIRAIQGYDRSKYQTRVEPVDEIMARHANEQTRFGLVNGGETAEDYEKRSAERLAQAREGAIKTFRGASMPDVFGAGEYLAQAKAVGSKLAQIGAGKLNPSNPVNPTEVDLPRAIHAATASQFRMAVANGGGDSRKMDAPEVARVAASLLYTHENSTAYTDRVDAQRRATMAAQHAVGNASALDFAPATMAAMQGHEYKGAPDAFTYYGQGDWRHYIGAGSAFTGQTALQSGGLGGGAYGQTGNIFTQISGRVGGADHIRTIEGTNKRLDKISTQFEQAWGSGSGGGSSGGGGASTTK